MAIFDQVFTRLFAFMTPLFAVSDSPPTYNSGEARPGLIDRLTGGIKVHVVGDTIASEAQALGTAFTYQKGQATTSSQAVTPGAYARGFVFENLSKTTSILIEQQGASATVTSWELRPGKALRFPLPNPGVLKVITAAGTANYQIGGVS